MSRASTRPTSPLYVYKKPSIADPVPRPPPGSWLAPAPVLPRKLVAQLFVQIHTYSACARMHNNFAQAYAEARKTVEAPAIKKPMGTCRPIAATAVA